MNLLNHHEGNSKEDVSGYQRLRKKKPTYFHELRHLSKDSLILIAVDRASLHLIRRFSKTCLFCHEDAAIYDLDFCYQREIWVLYADQRYFMSAMQLAYTVQRLGASKVLAILTDPQWTKEIIDV